MCACTTVPCFIGFVFWHYICTVCSIKTNPFDFMQIFNKSLTAFTLYFELQILPSIVIIQWTWGGCFCCRYVGSFWLRTYCIFHWRNLENQCTFTWVMELFFFIGRWCIFVVIYVRVKLGRRCDTTSWHWSWIDRRRDVSRLNDTSIQIYCKFANHQCFIRFRFGSCLRFCPLRPTMCAL